MRPRAAPIDFPLMSESPSASSGLLASITAPGDLKRLSQEQLILLAAEIRDFLVAKVSRTGGTSGPTSAWSR